MPDPRSTAAPAPARKPAPPAPPPPFGEDFFKSAKLPGESFFACIDRTQNALLGETGAKVLNTIAPVSASLSLLTQSFGTRLASAGRVAGTNIIKTKVGRSFVDVVVRGGVEAGTVSAETAGAVTAASQVASKFVAPVTAVAVGLEGGFFFACR